MWECVQSRVMGVLFGGFSHARWWKWSEERVHWQVRTLAGHSGDVFSVAFSLDGTCVVSGSADKLVKIWNAKAEAKVRSFVGGR